MSKQIILAMVFLVSYGCTYAAYGVKTPYAEIERLELQIERDNPCKAEEKKTELLCKPDQWVEGCV